MDILKIVGLIPNCNDYFFIEIQIGKNFSKEGDFEKQKKDKNLYFYPSSFQY